MKENKKSKNKRRMKKSNCSGRNWTLNLLILKLVLQLLTFSAKRHCWVQRTSTHTNLDVAKMIAHLSWEGPLLGPSWAWRRTWARRRSSRSGWPVSPSIRSKLPPKLGAVDPWRATTRTSWPTLCTSGSKDDSADSLALLFAALHCCS